MLIFLQLIFWAAQKLQNAATNSEFLAQVFRGIYIYTRSLRVAACKHLSDEDKSR